MTSCFSWLWGDLVHLTAASPTPPLPSPTAHAISCGHAKFCCVTMLSILRAKTLKQQASALDESEEVKRHGWKNAHSLIVTAHSTIKTLLSFATSTFSDSRFLRHMALYNHDILLHVTGHKVMVHSTKIIVTICHVNMLRSELFQTNGQCTFMTLLPPAGRQGHKE